jgi:hypothetical protein
MGVKRKPLVRWRLNARVRVDPGSAPDILNEESSGTQAGSRVRSSGLHDSRRRVATLMGGCGEGDSHNRNLRARAGAARQIGPRA